LEIYRESDVSKKVEMLIDSVK